MNGSTPPAAPVIVADFGPDGPRGRKLIDAARAAGAGWAATDVGEDPSTLRPTVRAAAESGTGLYVRLGDTRALLDLADTVGETLGERNVPSLRDRFLVVVSSERAGKRLRTDAAWAPSAVDLGAIGGGLLGLLRTRFPQVVRGACACDDLVVPVTLFPAPKLPRVAAGLRLRGGRLWVTGVDRADLARWSGGPAHGLVVTV